MLGHDHIPAWPGSSEKFLDEMAADVIGRTYQCKGSDKPPESLPAEVHDHEYDHEKIEWSVCYGFPQDQCGFVEVWMLQILVDQQQEPVVGMQQIIQPGSSRETLQRYHDTAKIG
jgi:hypothetical protein